jgi:hypothetical protein
MITAIGKLYLCVVTSYTWIKWEVPQYREWDYFFLHEATRIVHHCHYSSTSPSLQQHLTVTRAAPHRRYSSASPFATAAPHRHYRSTSQSLQKHFTVTTIVPRRHYFHLVVSLLLFHFDLHLLLRLSSLHLFSTYVTTIVTKFHLPHQFLHYVRPVPCW